MAQANEFLERYRQFWEASFQRLDVLLDEMQANEAAGKKRARKKTPLKKETK